MTQTPQPITLSALELRHQLGQVIHNILVKKSHYILENHALPVAVIMPLEEYQTYCQLKEQHA